MTALRWVAAALLGTLVGTATLPAYGALPLAGEPVIDLGGRPLPTADGLGSTDPADPTELTAGLWSDRLGAASGNAPVHHFVYHRTMQDSTVHIGVVGAPLGTEGDGLDIEVTAGSDTCATDDESPDYPVHQAAFGARVWVGAAEPGDRSNTCLTARSLAVAIGRGVSSADTELPVAIKVVEEAPVTSTAGDLPSADPSASHEPLPAAGAGDEVEGGSSFDDAPTVEAGSSPTSLTTTVAEGDQRLYRVPLDWGQRLVVDGVVPAQDPATNEVLQYSSPTVQLRVVEPSRNTISAVVEGTDPDGSYDAEEDTAVSIETPRVAYLNRFEDVVATLPGDYWLAIAVSPPTDDREPVEVPVELEVAVTGDTGGAPSYADSVLAPDNGTGPEGYSPQTPYLVADGEFSALPSDSPVAAPGDAGGWGARQWAGVGLGLVSLALCALGTWRLLPARQ